MSTYFPKAGEIVRKWYVVDASGQTLGRLASQVARILMSFQESPGCSSDLPAVSTLLLSLR